MNVFVAGVHGVGKTYLAGTLPKGLSLKHTSASKLIKEEMGTPNWGTNKLVADVDANQVALIAAVKRNNEGGTRLLLDGHFVLLNGDGSFNLLDTRVFASLNLSGVILIEAEAQTILDRVASRDGLNLDLSKTHAFLDVERKQAERVCSKLGIPLVILHSPFEVEFSEAVASVS